MVVWPLGVSAVHQRGSGTMFVLLEQTTSHPQALWCLERDNGASRQTNFASVLGLGGLGGETMAQLGFGGRMEMARDDELPWR
jgi:hypothetical protein